MKDTIEINQIPLEDYLPAEDLEVDGLTDREVHLALAIGNEVLNTALTIYANNKLRDGDLDEEFFRQLADAKNVNFVQMMILKCFSENISRINFQFLPDDSQRQILQDISNGKLRGLGEIPKDYADKMLRILNSDGDNLESEIDSIFFGDSRE